MSMFNATFNNIYYLFIVFVHLYFQQNQCLNIKKHAIHNTHILAWDPRATTQPVHALRRHCVQVFIHFIEMCSYIVL